MTREIKFIDLFAGMGGFRLGFENALNSLGMTGESVFVSEIKPHAKQAYNENFPKEKITGDITKVSPTEIPDFDVMLAGFPCFVAGTLITTNNGLKNIEDVVKGEYVLTHNNRYREVLTHMIKHKKGIHKIKVLGSEETNVTEEHPFYVRERFKDSNGYSFSEPKWVNAEDLVPNVHFVGFSVNKESKNPHDITLEEAWILGRYIADGYIQDSKRPNRENSYHMKTIICVGKDKVEDFEKNVKDYRYTKSENRTVYKMIIYNKRLMELARMCGRGSENKEFPTFLLELPVELLEKAIEGYLSGDGSFKDRVYNATTVSKKLVYSLSQAIQKVYNISSTILYSKRPDKHIIEGRVVNQRDTYRIQFRIESKIRHTYFIDGMLWNPVKKNNVDPDWEGYVYNFEVEEDNSYSANNMIVHNCQPFSSAGSRQGFEDTRGTLFFDVARIIAEKQPYGVILENVEGLVTHDKGRTLSVITRTLKDLGYEVNWKVFDSKDFQLAQSRKRIYIVATKGTKIDLEGFPIKEQVLKEVLEYDVPPVDTPFSQQLLSHYTWEQVVGKKISDKRGGKSNIHSWDFELKGNISPEQKELLEALLLNRRNKKWAEEIGIAWMDGMPLTMKQIETFFEQDALQEMLDDLVEKGYIRYEHPKQKVGNKRVPDPTLEKGYNIVSGTLSFEYSRILDLEGVTPTLVATDVSKLGVPIHGGIRPLTVREGLRLFGFPEEYTLNSLSTNKAYDLLGNTVTIPVVEAIAERLLEHFE